MLKIEELHVHYGGIKALQGVSLHVPKGKIVTLLGANGAGKSTTLRAIMRLANSDQGTILYNNESLLCLKTKEVVEKGVVMVPEGRRIFPNLTIDENLTLGGYIRKDYENLKRDREKIFSLFPRLKERVWQKAGTLSGGEQQMLAVGRALMSNPKLLLMDEPSLGLAPLIVKDIFNIIREINSQGVTILLVEQNAKAALNVADYGYVIETGHITLEGTGEELLSNDKVQEAYLGE